MNNMAKRNISILQTGFTTWLVIIDKVVIGILKKRDLAMNPSQIFATNDYWAACKTISNQTWKMVT